MKMRNFVLVFIVFVILTNLIISKRNKEDRNDDYQVYEHPLDKSYDTLANIFEDEKYLKKKLTKVIGDYGPLMFRRENKEWHIYHFDSTPIYKGSRFKLYKIPLDSVYDKEFKFTQKREKFYKTDLFGSNDSRYLIESRKNLHNIYSADGNDYNSNTDSYKSYELTNELKMIDFGYNTDSDTVESINGSALIFNTTNEDVSNIKLKISVYDHYFNGNKITEDVIDIEGSVSSGEMKIVEVHYKPSVSYVKDEYTAMDIDLINSTH
ncbi:hypothetical protein N9K91_04045 [Schleiferiaceae bacterium]|nr:hypothetical protein [Schleiferiaceae bacterium]